MNHPTARTRRSAALGRAALFTALVASLGACATSTLPGSTGTTSPPVSPSSPSPAGPSTPSLAPSSPSVVPSSPVASGTSCAALAASLPLAAQVGQLLMVGVQDQLTESARAAITNHRVGSVVLLGNNLGDRVDVAALTSQISSLEDELPILVSVDQEGGRIQRLSGQGFSTIPSAVVQSRSSASELTASWTAWGKELTRAGVDYNLAPVADVVPKAKQGSNEPIGLLHRQYGATAAQATPKVVAALDGMHQARLLTSVKHFPGLGQVVTNTDYGAATDTVIGPHDPGLAVFEGAIKAGTDSVMVSNAIYTELDPKQPAVFSSAVITDLLRTRMGFTGVVISDDLGAAEAVAGVAVGERAVRFVAAGGDLVINADPDTIGTMANALIGRALSDATFAAQIKASAGRVLAMKAKVASVGCH